MTIERMRIEMLKKKSSGKTPVLIVANQAPATPPKNAPDAYAHVFVRISGMPIAAAAVSSSRIAIHARPSRESRNLMLQKIVISSSPSAVQNIKLTKFTYAPCSRR